MPADTSDRSLIRREQEPELDVRDGQLTMRRSLHNEANEVIAPKHNKARTVPLSPGIPPLAGPRGASPQE